MTENTIKNAISYLLRNHGHKTYNDFLNCITKKGLAKLMIGYTELIHNSKECDHPYWAVVTKCLGEINHCAKCGKNL